MNGYNKMRMSYGTCIYQHGDPASILRAGLEKHNAIVNLLSKACNIDAAYAETLITPRTRASIARPPVWPFS